MSNSQIISSVIRAILSYIILLSIYLTGNYIDTGMGFTIYWYYFPCLLLILLGFSSDTKIDFKVFLFLIGLMLYSLLTYNYGLTLVIKQLANIIFSTLTYYYLLKMEHFNFERIFYKYIQISKIVLILGFIQVLLFAVNKGELFIAIFPFLDNTNIYIRFQSITSEPSFLTLGFIPVVFLSLYTLFYGKIFHLNKTWSVLFLVGYLLTFAATAYVGLLLMLLILYFKNFSLQKLALVGAALAAIFFVAWISYSNILLIKERVDDTVTGLTGDFTENENYKKVNLSSYIMLSHFHVTKESLRDAPVTGNGLGTHELTYDHHLPEPLQRYYTFNRSDAGSMAFRLLTETGIIGLLVFCFFTLKYRIRSIPSFTLHQEILWIINASVFVLIVLYLLRNGNYTINGKILFLLLYYYSFASINEKEHRHIGNIDS